MEVGDGFASMSSVVDDDAEAIFGIAFLSRDLSRLEHEVPEEGLVSRLRKSDAGDGFFGDEKKVDRSLGGDITKAERQVIFIDDVGRDFAGDDFFKEGGFSAHCSRVR